MILQNFINKCKQKKEIVFSILLLSIAIISFAFGRLSVLENQKGSYPTISNKGLEASNINNISYNTKISDIKNEENLASPILKDGGLLVASKNGNKYHFPWCSGARTINEANKIYFNSEKEARDAGYTPASNCKGLK